MDAKYLYANNTGADISMHHAAIVEAIENGGVFGEDYADLFAIAKTPEGSAAEYVVTFA